MTRMTKVARAESFTEGERIQAILATTGIESHLVADGEHEAAAVVVPDSSLEAAQDAIEAMTEPDESIVAP